MKEQHYTIFLTQLKREEFSNQSIKLYMHLIKRFFEFMEANYDFQAIDEITELDLIDYKNYLAKEQH